VDYRGASPLARPPPLFSRLLFLTLLVSIFGAGVVDVLYNDVIPIRPYTGVFQTNIVGIAQAVSSRAVSHGGLIGDLFGAIILIVFASSLFGVIANFTTGTTIAHSRFNNATVTFTPNPNITRTVGLVPIVQLIPFLFGAMILLMVYAIFERRFPGGL